ncbi:MAG: ribosomal protein S18-alanine N-acetyltransferase [Oscillospiraceae bacterium]|nr:ribosomal protein S18-alanine N-acetyltransferase [Oscillospiraceae bacterium]
MTQKVDILVAEYDDIADVALAEKMIFSDPWNERSLSECIDSDKELLLVAKCNGKIAGYITVSYIFDEANINRIAVLPEYRGQKIGSALICKMEEIFGETVNIYNLEVRESNIYAQNMYTQNGYETVGKRKRFYRGPDEDAILMTKRKVMI